MSVNELMLIVFLLNLPFGYWRCSTGRFSRQWMMAVHIPVPFIFLLRLLSGFGWKIIPLLMGHSRTVCRRKTEEIQV